MKSHIDVVIVGGGPAGLQSAMMLGRANRHVLVCDDGRPRNAPAEAMHYFPSRDGIAPAEFRAACRRDLENYPKVEFRASRVLSVNREEGVFSVELDDGSQWTARKVVLATGVEDILPEISGIGPLYGKTVFHCPYCHGYEFKDKAVGILGDGEFAFMMSGVLYSISQKLTVFTNGPHHFSKEQTKAFEERGIRIVEESISEFLGEGGVLSSVQLRKGEVIRLDGMLVHPMQRSRSPLPDVLDCLKNEMGSYVVDGENRSSVPGVFIAGDNMNLRQSALVAAYFGMMCGVSVNHELVKEDWGH